MFWGDERAVAPDDADSNYGQVRASWLDRVAIPPERIHRMRGEQVDLDAAARDYEATLVSLLGAEPAFDLVWLGVGPDGHVCSLFPGHALLDEKTRLVAAIHDSPKPPPRRITLDPAGDHERAADRRHRAGRGQGAGRARGARRSGVVAAAGPGRTECERTGDTAARSRRRRRRRDVNEVCRGGVPASDVHPGIVA